MVYNPNLFNTEPYYDDFDSNKGFLRFLYRPGFAVQARELTQMQTLLQDQMQKYADHIFSDGSIVSGGQVTENILQAVRFAGLSGAAYDEIAGSEILYSGNPIGRIIYTESGLTGTNTDTLGIAYVHYTSGLTFTDAMVVSGTANSNPYTFTIKSMTGFAGSFASEAKLITVASGVRYVDGFFVGFTGQSIGAYNVVGSPGSEYRSFADPNVRIGFVVDRSFINSTDDTSLLDPAFGSYNYNAPGSDRYKISLNLTQYNYDNTDTAATDNLSRVDFVEFMRIVDGNTIKLEKYPDYSILEDTLARRTYDESGNYTVKPFDLSVNDITANSESLNIKIEAGKAYIFGYEFETQGSTNLTVSKARSERSIEDEFFDRQVGPYLTAKFNSTASNFDSTFNVNDGTDFVISSGYTTDNCVTVGTTKIRQVSLKNISDSTYYLYLYDINFTGSNDISSFKRVFKADLTAGGKQLFEIPYGTTASLEAGNYNNLLFEVNNISLVNAMAYKPEIYYNVNKFVSFDVSGHATVSVTPYENFGSIDISPGNFPQSSLIIYNSNGVSLTGSVEITGSPRYLDLELSVSGPTQCYASYEVRSESDTFYRVKNIITEEIQITGPDATILTDTNGEYILLKKLVDVVEVYAITGHTGAGYTADMTNTFYLDSGQNDNYYDWAKIRVNSTVNTSSFTGPYTLSLTRYEQSGFGPLVVNSYLDGTNEPYDGRSRYDWIPSYTSKSTGYKYNLSDVFDFRPYRDLSGSFTGCHVPSDNISSSVTYNHYLPRTDKIVLTRDRKFKVISGSPSIDAKAPSDDTDAMTLYSITYNPYTYDSKDTTIRYVENRRYTMRDIGKIEKRVDNLEFYTSLSLVEQEAKNTEIYDEEGLSRPKLGILVDTFKGHSKGDVQDENYKCAIDFEKSELRPRFRTIVEPYTSISSVGVGITRTSDNIIMANFTTTPALFQTVVTDNITVNDTGVYNYVGSISTSPSSNLWYDQNNEALVKVNVQGENDAWESSGTGHGFGTQWNDWELNWLGKEIVEDQISRQNQYDTSRSTELYSNSSAMNINNRSVPENITKNNLNRYVNESIVPYIKSGNISVSAEGLKPNTRHYAYFDGSNVESHISGSLTSDQYGRISGLTFALPTASFRTGQRLIRITDSPLNSVTGSNSAADYVFYAKGYVQNRESGIVSVRPGIVRRASTQTEEIINNILNRPSTNYPGQYDYMAQSFLVSSSEYPDGMFIKSIGLLMHSKESNNNEPICVQLRPVINGYPHPSKILPFAEKYLYPTDISTSATGSQTTNFVFSSPVYVSPGEYAVVIKTNSPNYKINTARSGGYSINDNTQRASDSAIFGSLYRPQNGGLYTPDYSEDLCFVVNRCEFDTVNTKNFKIDLNSSYTSTVDYNTNIDLVRIVTEDLIPTNTTISYKSDPISGLYTNVEYPTNKNLIPDVSYTINSGTNPTSNKSLITFTVTNKVSPVIDLERFAVYYISNEINNNRNNTDTLELEPTPEDATYPALSRYITKSVELDDSVEATGLYVYLNAYRPYEGSIKVYMRRLPYGVFNGIESESWIEMTSVGGRNSINQNDYVDLQYTLSPEISRYGIFQVKIVFASSSSTNSPRIRNMRAIVV